MRQHRDMRDVTGGDARAGDAVPAASVPAASVPAASVPAEARDVVTHGFATFDTVLGTCGIAWGPGGITGVELPDGTAHETSDALAARFPGAVQGAPPAAVAAAIGRISDVLAGADDDLADVGVDLTGRTEFERRAYALARTIRPGSTRSYGELAAELGSPGAARAVGRAMGANPVPIIVPCHRVVGAHGAMVGFSAHGGAHTKRRMLLAEGVAESGEPGLFDAAELFAGP